MKKNHHHHHYTAMTINRHGAVALTFICCRTHTFILVSLNFCVLNTHAYDHLFICDIVMYFRSALVYVCYAHDVVYVLTALDGKKKTTIQQYWKMAYNLPYMDTQCITQFIINCASFFWSPALA